MTGQVVQTTCQEDLNAWQGAQPAHEVAFTRVTRSDFADLRARETAGCYECGPPAQVDNARRANAAELDVGQIRPLER